MAELRRRLSGGLRFAWAALAHDGGEYGLAGAVSGGIMWTVILVALIVLLGRYGIFR